MISAMKCAGFTLIEVIVVIAIISILMALSVPALQSGRRYAEAVYCGSNIRQLLLGLQIYETANQRFPYAVDDTHVKPPPGGWPGEAAYDRAGWWWFSQITSYTRKNNGEGTNLLCPSKDLKGSIFDRDVLCGNYGVNQSIIKSRTGMWSWRDFVGESLSAIDIPMPQQTLLIVDSGYSMINWCHAVAESPLTLTTMIEHTAYIPGLSINQERTNFWPGQIDDAIDGRHPNKTVNAGYVDGHVSRIKADKLLVEEAEDGYRNLCPLWLPK
ncbi:prepilin-type N-terminal cleavage/methylation domain-containing protein [Planctomycetota bacterium]